ncbi:UNVERIFIED_CONTAM: hypothetical protein NCL1_29304 [Trichonephila clavipes]
MNCYTERSAYILQNNRVSYSEKFKTQKKRFCMNDTVYTPENYEYIPSSQKARKAILQLIISWFEMYILRTGGMLASSALLGAPICQKGYYKSLASGSSLIVV